MPEHQLIKVARKVPMFGATETWNEALERTCHEHERDGWAAVEVDRDPLENDKNPHIAVLMVRHHKV